jgi:hypothetical protein
MQLVCVLRYRHQHFTAWGFHSRSVALADFPHNE